MAQLEFGEEALSLRFTFVLFPLQRVINRWNKLSQEDVDAQLFQESTREKTYTADGLL